MSRRLYLDGDGGGGAVGGREEGEGPGHVTVIRPVIAGACWSGAACLPDFPTKGIVTE